MKKVSYFVCTNGYGHFVRMMRICKHLSSEYKIDVYCSERQYQKFKPNLNVNFKFYSTDNIRWDKIMQKNSPLENEYFNWLEKYGKIAAQYDLVLSDNLVSLLKYNTNTIIIGSFLWKDVLEDKFSGNKISKLDEELINQHNPLILTNKYAETGTLKSYSNKRGFGWGCDIKKPVYWKEPKKIILVEPSLNYSTKYVDFLEKIKKILILSKYKVDNSPAKTTTCIFFARPGLGTLTHCVENNIPIIALYSKDDSKEIIELAKRVDQLKIGFSYRIDRMFDLKKLNSLLNNEDIYKHTNFNKQGYKEIAKFLKNL